MGLTIRDQDLKIEALQVKTGNALYQSEDAGGASSAGCRRSLRKNGKLSSLLSRSADQTTGPG
jgi:hypothetical protein